MMQQSCFKEQFWRGNAPVPTTKVAGVSRCDLLTYSVLFSFVLFLSLGLSPEVVV